MLLLPLDEDSLLFRLCVCYGLLVLLLELLVPLLFQRRVRLEIPRLNLRAPVVPLTAREFQRRRLVLQQQLAALRLQLAETPRRSPQKRRQLLADSATKNRPAASPQPSPSPLTSPTSSVKVSRPQSSRRSGRRRRIGWEEEEEEESKKSEGDAVHRPRREVTESERQPPTAMGSSLRRERRGGFSFDEVIEERGEEKIEEEETREEESEDFQDWRQAVNTRTARRRESPTFSGRRPVRLVSEEVGPEPFAGPSEAAARLEALIGARRRRRQSTSHSYGPPPPPPLPARNHAPPEVPVLVAEAFGADSATAPEVSVSDAAETTPQEDPPPPVQQHDGSALEEDEETKESEKSESVSDFQAFCASFAAGGSEAAQQAVAKRKHHEAFGPEDVQPNASDSTVSLRQDKPKHPRIFGQDHVHSNGAATATAAGSGGNRKDYQSFVSDDPPVDANATAAPQPEDIRKHPQEVNQEVSGQPKGTPLAPRSVEKRTRYEAFGSEDEQEIDAVVSSPQVLDKRSHDEAFGSDQRQERPQEKYDCLPCDSLQTLCDF
jgi:hypothetical protein